MVMASVMVVSAAMVVMMRPNVMMVAPHVMMMMTPRVVVIARRRIDVRPTHQGKKLARQTQVFAGKAHYRSLLCKLRRGQKEASSTNAAVA